LLILISNHLLYMRLLSVRLNRFFLAVWIVVSISLICLANNNVYGQNSVGASANTASIEKINTKQIRRAAKRQQKAYLGEMKREAKRLHKEQVRQLKATRQNAKAEQRAYRQKLRAERSNIYRTRQQATAPNYARPQSRTN
jgi:hypothetical protein